MTKRLLYGSIYFLCFLSVSFLSCKKSVDTNSTSPGNSFPIPVATPVNGSVSGRIIDENLAAVAAATVECAGITTTTDADGFFNINDAILDKYITTVTVTKTGYFKGYRSFCANASRNIVSIKLVPRLLAGTIESASGGTITLPNTTAINFQQNSIVIKSTGAAYGGMVNVYASYIDPTSTDISQVVPGSFMGMDASNMYVLKSTGMLAVEMESTAGEPLQLEANKPATVKLPIPASLLSKAPNSIDTWSLNDKGVWEKEGTAVKTGDQYEFFASHFSFWNCDQPSVSIYLNLHIGTVGSNLAGTTVSISAPNTSSLPGTTYGTTDLDGNVSGMVPAQTVLELNLFAGSAYLCPASSSFYSENIGPFSTNASQNIVATTPGPANGNLHFSGTANDCNGPLQDGYAMIYTDQYFVYAPITNGNYAGILALCAPVDSVMVKIVYNSTYSQSAPTVIPVAGNSVVVPAITVSCIVLNSYDGIYSVESGWTTRYASPGVPSGDALSGDLTGNPDVYMVTTGPFSCGIPAPVAGTPGYLYWHGGTSGVAGIDPLEVAVDGTNNTTITSATVANLANLAGHINSYDPVTKTFHLSFTWTNTAGAPRDYEIVLKYKQPRP